jgi:hypothetical protein
MPRGIKDASRSLIRSTCSRSTQPYMRTGLSQMHSCDCLFNFHVQAGTTLTALLRRRVQCNDSHVNLVASCYYMVATRTRSSIILISGSAQTFCRCRRAVR